MNVIDRLRPLVSCLDEMKSSYPPLFAEILEQEYDDIGFQPKDVEGRNVIDIGAHVGMFSLLCHANGARSILCVEANPVNFRKLVGNLAKVDSITGFLNYAVFDGSQERVLVSNKGTQSAISTEGQEVKCASLDQILSLYDEDVVMKMDIEGAEYVVLPSASKTNLRKCKTIFLETHRTDHAGNVRSSQFMKEYVSSFGFAVEKEQQFASWDVDDHGKPFNYRIIPNMQSFRFTRIG